MQQQNNEELIDIINGISDHKEMLKLCVADYLIARTVIEVKDFAKEIMFVYEKKESHPEIWLRYQENQEIVSVLEKNQSDAIKYEDIFALSLKYAKRNIEYIPKFLADYYILREKYNIASLLSQSFQEMTRYECCVHCEDFIELNKGYAWAITHNETADISYFELNIFGKEKINEEIRLAKKFLDNNDCDKNFLQNHIDLLRQKMC